MKICLYCTCMGQNARMLAEDSLRAALDSDIRLVVVDRLCDAARCREVLTEAVAHATSSQVVVAACSRDARGGEALNCVQKALPAVRVELADIREGCAWHASVSGEEEEERAAQAAALVRMAFVRLECAEVAPKAVVPCSLGVLVVGAGPAGMAAANALAGLGVPVTLAERRPRPGGMAMLLGKLFPHMAQSSDVLRALPLEGVNLRMGCDVVSLRREDAAYVAGLREGDDCCEERFDALILAVGAQPVLPGVAFGAKERKGIISQMELDTLLTAVETGRKEAAQLASDYVFVQCVHARSTDKPYCSAVCCPTAVKNALRVKNLRPDAEVVVLNRQMVMPGIALENLYRDAMLTGVRFVHVDSLNDIRVEGKERVEAVVLPALDGEGERRITAEALVCSTPLQPVPSSVELVRQLGVCTDAQGFMRGHEPAHPLESNVEGVFICGSARWPVYVDQAVAQGKAAAALAVRFIRERRMPMDEIADLRSPAHISQELCSACGRCVEACPHAACFFADEGEVLIAEELCRRCGVCTAICPCGAARLPMASPSPREILAAVRHSRQRSLS